MPDRFAIIGWGSLLWDDTHADFNAQVEAWQYDGPTLPVEFSRVSKTRDGALTLVLDPTNGALITVAWALSRRTDFAAVMDDLRLREGTTRTNIGFVNGANNCGRFPQQVETIRLWAAPRELNGVVWTDLASNFSESAGQSFSLQAARTHLDGLCEKGKAQARLYVDKAPPFVQTPLRHVLADFVA